MKTRGCVVGQGNVLREVLCLFLGRNRMSLVRACCSQQRAWPGGDRAGHAWLSSTSCPRRDVLFSWQHLLLLYRARDRDCCFFQGRRCQNLPSSFPRNTYFSARQATKFNSNLLQYPERLELFAAGQHGELNMPGCFLYPICQSPPHV